MSKCDKRSVSTYIIISYFHFAKVIQSAIKAFHYFDTRKSRLSCTICSSCVRFYKDNVFPKNTSYATLWFACWFVYAGCQVQSWRMTFARGTSSLISGWFGTPIVLLFANPSLESVQFVFKYTVLRRTVVIIYRCFKKCFGSWNRTRWMEKNLSCLGEQIWTHIISQALATKPGHDGEDFQRHNR